MLQSSGMPSGQLLAAPSQQASSTEPASAENDARSHICSGGCCARHDDWMSSAMRQSKMMARTLPPLLQHAADEPAVRLIARWLCAAPGGSMARATKANVRLQVEAVERPDLSMARAQIAGSLVPPYSSNWRHWTSLKVFGQRNRPLLQISQGARTQLQRCASPAGCSTLPAVFVIPPPRGRPP